jgi:hypothetical protein
MGKELIEDRDPLIDGSMWLQLSQEEAKEIIMRERRVINNLKHKLRGACGELRREAGSMDRLAVDLLRELDG